MTTQEIIRRNEAQIQRIDELLAPERKGMFGRFLFWISGLDRKGEPKAKRGKK